ncbi:hypothetical protein AXG93_3158s1070 [Marchantia polymorpha subsp. ruderalis]|nr:hypothetical protein AXG93_3158s1070 [Marchantia polymorpha subsp. ruderalis]
MSDPGSHHKHSPTLEPFPEREVHSCNERKRAQEVEGLGDLPPRRNSYSEGDISLINKWEGKIAAKVGNGPVGRALHEHREKKKEKKKMEELEKKHEDETGKLKDQGRLSF